MSVDSPAPVILDIEKPDLNEEDKELLCHPAVGGLILFTRNFADTQQLQELLKELRMLRSDLLICIDHEGGRVQRFRKGFTHLPPMQALGELYGEDRAQAQQAAALLGWLMAAELLAYDIDISFAPVLDLDRDFSSIIGNRAFSADADVAVVLAEHFIGGMQSAGMKATGKHFPGHGGVHGDSHLELPVDTRTRAELDIHDLVPFVKLMPLLQGIMPAHIVFPEIDSQPVGFSSIWVRDILKAELGFAGVVFSDDLSMEGAAIYPRYAERAQAALDAGCDSILICNQRSGAIEIVEYVETVRKGLQCVSLRSMCSEQQRMSKAAVQGDLRYDAAQKYVENLHRRGGN